MNPVPPQILARLREEARRERPAGLDPLVERILARYGEAVQAVLFYGSCKRTGREREGVVDLYVLVDSYRSAHGATLLALLNRLLPPNVYYVEVPLERGVVRAKYAVLSLTQFERGTSPAWFQSYLWARFAQPLRLLYARSEVVEHRVYRAQGRAVLTFLTRILPRAPELFTARELWATGFLLSYRAELRAERADRAEELAASDEAFYEEITRLALPALPYEVKALPGEGPPIHFRARIGRAVRVRNAIGWRFRSVQGKCLNVLRLGKGLLTFEGGFDYVLWKIERHSGEGIPPDAFWRRHPAIGIWVIIWRLYRRKAFR